MANPLIKLTNWDTNKDIYVSVPAIVLMEPADAYTCLVFGNGVRLRVTEPPQNIFNTPSKDSTIV